MRLVFVAIMLQCIKKINCLDVNEIDLFLVPLMLYSSICSFICYIFVQCFFARLGFIQPPSCLKCAYKSSGCGANAKNDEAITTTTINTKCNELVPWRIDANIPLHPDKLEGNVVFVTCATARCLVNGDAYPSIRWDTKKKRLIISDRRQTI